MGYIRKGAYAPFRKFLDSVLPKRGEKLLVQNTTDCSGVDTGSIQTLGGAYIAKSLLVGGTLSCGAITSSGAFSATTGTFRANITSLPDLWSFSGLKITGVTDTNKMLVMGYETTGNYGYIQAGRLGTAYSPLHLNPNGVGVVVGAGGLSTSGKIETTSTASDSIKTAGGLVTAKRITVDDTTDATTGLDGSLQTDGGLSVAKSAVIVTNAYFGGTSTGIYGATSIIKDSVTASKILFKGSPDGTGVHHSKIESSRDASTFSYGSQLKFYTEGKNSGTTDTSTLALTINSNQKATFTGAIETTSTATDSIKTAGGASIAGALGCGAITSSGDLTLSTTKGIQLNTADGADSGYTFITGGGAPARTRGGYILLYGNEASGETGSIRYTTGIGGSHKFFVPDAGGNNVTAGEISNITGLLKWTGKIETTSTASDSIKTAGGASIAGALGCGAITSTATGTVISIATNNSGANNTMLLENTNNANGSSGSRLVIATNPNGGDAFTRYAVQTVGGWEVGLDNSDSDAFNICYGSIGTSPALKIDTSKNFTFAGKIETTSTASDSIKTAGGVSVAGDIKNGLSTLGHIKHGKQLSINDVASVSGAKITATNLVTTATNGLAVMSNLKALVSVQFAGNSTLCGVYLVELTKSDNGGANANLLEVSIKYTKGTAGNWTAITTGDVSVSAISETGFTINIDNPGAGAYHYALHVIEAINIDELTLGLI